MCGARRGSGGEQTCGGEVWLGFRRDGELLGVSGDKREAALGESGGKSWRQ
jgi:hypothetical protein